MAVRPIVIYGDPVLPEKAQPVETIDREIKDLVSDLTDTLKEAQGLGLAAPQIGVSRRVFIIDLSVIDINADLKVFINPEIIEAGGEPVEYEEGCLSFPGLYQKITRPAWVKVRAIDINGNAFEIATDGMLARAIQHEFDHLEGILFIDRMSALTRTMIQGRLRKLQKVS